MILSRWDEGKDMGKSPHYDLLVGLFTFMILSLRERKENPTVVTVSPSLFSHQEMNGFSITTGN